jgi:hypothetical protein
LFSLSPSCCAPFHHLPCCAAPHRANNKSKGGSNHQLAFSARDLPSLIIPKDLSPRGVRSFSPRTPITGFGNQGVKRLLIYPRATFSSLFFVGVERREKSGRISSTHQTSSKHSGNRFDHQTGPFFCKWIGRHDTTAGRETLFGSSASTHQPTIITGINGYSSAISDHQTTI